MSASSALLKQLLERRASWLVLREAAEGQPALEVLLMRPPEAEVPRLLGRSDDGATVQERMHAAVVRYCTDWRGFSAAELLGPAVGSADPIDFDRDLWAEVVSDNGAWLVRCSKHITDAITQHAATREATAKN